MKRKIFGTFGLKILLTGLSFVTSILLARLLGSDAYGIYTYTNTWVLLLGVFSGLGLRSILVKEIAIYQANSNDSLLLGLIRWANIAVALVSIALGSIAAIVVWLYVFDSNQQLAWAFWITLALLPFNTLTSLRQGAMQGLNKLVIGQIPETVVQPVLFLLVVGAIFLFFPASQNVNAILGVKLFTTIVAFIIGCILLAKAISLLPQTNLPKYDAKAWSRSILPFLLIGLTHTINNKTDTLMLGYIKAPELVGMYFVSSRGAEIIGFILMAVNLSIAPEIARLYAEGNLNRLQKLITKSSQITFFTSFLLGGLFVVCGTWFLKLFGSEFTQGYLALIILCTAQIFNSFIGSVGILLDMTGHEKDSAIGISLSSVCNIIFNAVFIPRWGMEGAAIATAISIFIWNIYLTICVKKRLNIIPSPLGVIKI